MMNTSVLFKASAIVEILTGLAFLAAPSLVVGLLLGDGLGPTGIAVARVLGIGLLSLGVAAWESPGHDAHLATRTGLCMYNAGSALVLMALGTYGGMNGVLLWPVAVLHAIAGAMMLWVILAASHNEQN